MFRNLISTWIRFSLLRLVFNLIRKGKFGKSHLKTMGMMEYGLDILGAYLFKSKKGNRKTAPAKRPTK
jgi:hypothetical protein